MLLCNLHPAVAWRRYDVVGAEVSNAAECPKLMIEYTLSDAAPTRTPTATATATNTATSTPIVSPTPIASPTGTIPPVPVFSNASFVYDGDGKRVKSVLTTNLGTSTTIFVGSHYEITNGVVTKYYFAGAQRIAMRTGSTLNYLLSDHLGSTSLTTDASGNVLSQMKYKAWGEVRYSSGSMSTKYQYTGQFSYASDFGLLFYNARWVDPQLGRFAQADTIVPGGVQGLDRFAYVNNNPLRYTDPTGHMCSDPDDLWSPSCDGADAVGQVSHSGGLGVISGNSNSNTTVSGSGISSDNNYNINDWLWDNVPSAIGYHGGVSGQMGAGIEPGFTPFEFLLLFNWRSGEISLFYSFEGFVYGGSPSLLGGNMYGGLTMVEGLSRNQFYEGPSLFGGVAGALDAFGKLGATFVGGRSITSESAANGEIPPSLFIDPISQRPIEYHQASITFGGNLAGNGVDLGVLAGPAYSAELASIHIPFWPTGR